MTMPLNVSTHCSEISEGLAAPGELAPATTGGANQSASMAATHKS